MSQLNVLKFGGTSMGSATAMRAAARIVRANPHAHLVVVSAMSGATNSLLRAYELSAAEEMVALADTVGALFHRHRETLADFGSPAPETEDLAKLERELHSALAEPKSDRSLDAVLSLGERLSAVLFSLALRETGANVIVIDARTLLRTDARFGKAEPELTATKNNSERILAPLFRSGFTVVTQGFIGATSDGHTTTLGRGGSDYSAALLAEALEAGACEIWTDVSGILTMDPRTVPSARVIPQITFAEAAELANFGAKVLHPATLLPALRKNIKVFVGNTFQPEKGGTWIYSEIEDKPTFRAVAVRERQTLITVTSMRMLQASGFLAKLFTILAEHGLSVDLVTTSEVSVALTIDGTAQGSAGRSILENQRLMEDLRSIAEVSIEENLSLVALIGNRLTHSRGIASRAFRAVQESNVRLICHGASANNLCFLLSSEEAKAAAAELHREFL